MKRRLQIVAFLLSFAASPLVALAHTHLEKSIPAANSAGPAPKQIDLEFSEAAQLTALVLQQDGKKGEQKIGPLPAKAQTHIQIPAPMLSAGKYALKWRALSDDGHVMSGTVHFTVAGK